MNADDTCPTVLSSSGPVDLPSKVNNDLIEIQWSHQANYLFNLKCSKHLIFFNALANNKSSLMFIVSF